jgi:broad specificity phosphatase PhoE
MHVIGFCGYSGSGKTTLVEQLIVRLRLAGQRVSVVKHAHHDFDIDHEGKDSWRHRQAGAFEVVIASNRRLAKIREYPAIEEPTFDQLVARGLAAWPEIESALAAGSTVLVVGHAGALRALLCGLTGTPSTEQRRWQMDNAALSRLVWRSGNLSVDWWNDVTHHAPSVGAADAVAVAAVTE